MVTYVLIGNMIRNAFAVGSLRGSVHSVFSARRGRVVVSPRKKVKCVSHGRCTREDFPGLVSVARYRRSVSGRLVGDLCDCGRFDGCLDGRWFCWEGCWEYDGIFYF